MNPEVAIDLFKTTVMFALYTVAPFLLVLLVVGLVASLLQSITSMQEPTLTFAPKLVALAGAMLLLAPWLLRTLTEFTLSMFTRMATLAH
jgi:flagellar biosynthesis protein FliQ